jgi:hypothetical protein
MIVGVAHAEPPGEVAHEVEIDAPVIADSSIKIINKLTAIVADPLLSTYCTRMSLVIE